MRSKYNSNWSRRIPTIKIRYPASRRKLYEKSKFRAVEKRPNSQDFHSCIRGFESRRRDQRRTVIPFIRVLIKVPERESFSFRSSLVYDDLKTQTMIYVNIGNRQTWNSKFWCIALYTWWFESICSQKLQGWCSDSIFDFHSNGAGLNPVPCSINFLYKYSKISWFILLYML